MSRRPRSGIGFVGEPGCVGRASQHIAKNEPRSGDEGSTVRLTSERGLRTIAPAMSDPARDRDHRPILDADEMTRVIRRMAGEVLEREASSGGLLLVGIRTRGLPLAERIADAMAAMEGERPPIGALDITLYRDDLETIGPQPVVKGSELPATGIDGKLVVLCDDVLFTGRTVRAALDELGDYGRPRAVRLAVLIERGHRELPIRADIVGKKVESARSSQVEVAFEETDGHDGVRLLLAPESDRAPVSDKR